LKTKVKIADLASTNRNADLASVDRVDPNGRFARASIVGSMHWMVLHRPVELTALIGEVKCYFVWTETQQHIWV
jgi:hypothetical protein